MKASKAVLIPLLLAVSQMCTAAERGRFYDVETYPVSLSESCRGGVAKVYDECGSQMDIVISAFARAGETGKTLLLVYGAEWCIWCHVFDKYINGEHRAFSYEWEYEGEVQQWDMREQENLRAKNQARALNKFVADNFVVAHVEGYFSADGLDVIDAIGFDRDEIDFLPFIFSIDKSGQYAAHMLASDAIPGLERRKDSGWEYRGFDRDILRAELIKLKSAAEAGG